MKYKHLGHSSNKTFQRECCRVTFSFRLQRGPKTLLNARSPLQTREIIRATYFAYIRKQRRKSALCSAAHQRLCFRYIDIAIPLLSKPLAIFYMSRVVRKPPFCNMRKQRRRSASTYHFLWLYRPASLSDMVGNSEDSGGFLMTRLITILEGSDHPRLCSLMQNYFLLKRLKLLLSFGQKYKHFSPYWYFIQRHRVTVAKRLSLTERRCPIHESPGAS